MLCGLTGRCTKNETPFHSVNPELFAPRPVHNHPRNHKLPEGEMTYDEDEYTEPDEYPLPMDGDDDGEKADDDA